MSDTNHAADHRSYRKRSSAIASILAYGMTPV